MKWSTAIAFLLALALNVLGASAPKTADCLACHDDKGASFQASVHGSLSCTDCHTDKNAYPHAAKAVQVKCDTCHAEPASGVAASVHASVSKQACEGCHGDVHAILAASNPKSRTYATNLPRTCGTCHGDSKLTKQHGLTEVYSQYMDSIHGFALTRDGLLVAASCSSCHGSHKILSKTNPASRTNRANVAATCGTCHAGPKQDYMAGIHGQLAGMGDSRAPVCNDCHTAHQIADVRTAAWQMKTTATCGRCHQESTRNLPRHIPRAGVGAGLCRDRALLGLSWFPRHPPGDGSEVDHRASQSPGYLRQMPLGRDDELHQLPTARGPAQPSCLSRRCGVRGFL